MIVNQIALLQAAPIVDMFHAKHRSHGVSYGLTEAGYDIRIAETVRFQPRSSRGPVIWVNGDRPEHMAYGRFTLAPAIEKFQMPLFLVGVVHDKSTWARLGLSVFNTVLEPGWNGGLTLELVYHGEEDLTIPAGAGIAQVLFTKILTPAAYEGKYQDQVAGQGAILEN